jgi:hypothetical protein
MGGTGTSAEELKAKAFKAIDEGFKEVLGDTGSRAIYYYFQVLTGLKIEDAVERPEALVSFLRNMFKAGAQVLERRVFEKLCVTFGVNPGEVEGADLVTLIKRILSKK